MPYLLTDELIVHGDDKFHQNTERGDPKVDGIVGEFLFITKKSVHEVRRNRVQCIKSDEENMRSVIYRSLQAETVTSKLLSG